MNSPPIIESPAASPAATSPADARPDSRGRRVRPAHVLGGALALTAAIMALGAPAPWPEGHAAPATVGVGAGGDAFDPAAVTVAQGDTVTWQWQSGQHSVTSTSGSEPFDSGAKTAGTFAHTFNTPGTFSYLCVWHANMKGTVTVTPAAAAPAADTAAPSPAGATAGKATSAATPAAAAAANPATAGGVPKLAAVRLSGPRLLFSLNHPATVATVAVARTRTTPVGRLDAKPGKGSMVLALNRLRVGRYTLLVGAKNALGQTTRTRVRVNVTWALRYRALAMQRAEASRTTAPAAASVPVVGQAAAAAAPTPGAVAPATPAAAAPADPAPPAQCGGSNHSGHGHGSGSPTCDSSSGSSNGTSGGNDSHGG